MKKIISVCTSVYAYVLMAEHAFAQGIGDPSALNTIKTKSGITEGNVGNIVGTVINGALSLVGIIFLVLMVYAGILWMTARGKDEQVQKAQQIIIASLIGLFITVSAYAITKFVTANFT